MPNYWPWVPGFPMIGVMIPIDLALCQLVSNDIGSENHHDKLGEKRQYNN